MLISPLKAIEAKTSTVNQSTNQNTTGSGDGKSKDLAQKSPDLPRSSFIQAMDAEFRKRDFNNDGKATRAEIEQFERDVAIAAARSYNQSMFLSLDIDRDGMLTPKEFSALVKEPTLIDVSKVMQRFDVNRDQMITLIEYRIATLQNFDRLDADKDGIVTNDEMKKDDNNKPSTDAGR